MKKNLPFDDVPSQQINIKSIPQGYEQFTEFIDYLATSPQINPQSVSNHIRAFLTSPKIKPTYLKSVYFAISKMDLPEDFWTPMLQHIKLNLKQDSEFAEAFITAIGGAPYSAVIAEFTNLSFLIPYLNHSSQPTRFAAFSTLYAFRSHITINEEIVQAILNNVESKLPQIIFIVLDWLIFLLSIDYHDIEKSIRERNETLKKSIIICGHLMNMRHLEFVLKYSDILLSDRILAVSHVSLSAATYILATLPMSSDFSNVVDVPSPVIMPLYINILQSPYSDGMRVELFSAALKVVRLQSQQMSARSFFESLADHLLAKWGGSDTNLIALFVDVAHHFGELPRILNKASMSENRIFYNQLMSAASLYAAENDVDITQDVMKLLGTYRLEEAQSWRIAASAALCYVWRRKGAIAQNFQQMLEIVTSIGDTEIMALFMAVLAKATPANGRQAVVDQLKRILFPERLMPYADTFSLSKVEHRQRLPTSIRTVLVSLLTETASEEELEDVVSDLRESMLAPFVGARTEDIPVSPFAACQARDIASLFSAMSAPASSDFLGVERPFVRVSPPSHALNVEVASVVNKKVRAFALDLRLSAALYTPELVVRVSVPTAFTPPQVSDWVVSNLEPGSKVSRRLTFTANKLGNPFLSIVVLFEGSTVLNLKVCVPLIDMFERVDVSGNYGAILWEKLSFEQPSDLPDMLFSSASGVVGVHNGVARADDPLLLQLLPSAVLTTAVVQ